MGQRCLERLGESLSVCRCDREPTHQSGSYIEHQHRHQLGLVTDADRTRDVTDKDQPGGFLLGHGRHYGQVRACDPALAYRCSEISNTMTSCYDWVMVHHGDSAALADLIEALSGLDLDVEHGASGAGDLVVHLPGQDVAIVVDVRKAPSPAGVLQLMDGVSADTNYRLLVVDHLSASVREVLEQHGWGYFDRGRGRLRLWAGPVRVDALIDGLSQGRRRPREALATAVGREVAVCLLIGDEPQSVRGVASQIERAPSSVSTALQALRAESLVEPGTTSPVVPELFWALAGVWGPSVRAVGLRECPVPGDAGRTAQLGLGLEGDVERSAGWALPRRSSRGGMGGQGRGRPGARRRLLRARQPCDTDLSPALRGSR